MPKIKWGSEISSSDIDNAESNQTSYDGPVPPKGVYGFKIKSMSIGKTSNDNPNVSIALELDPRNRAEHKKFEGFFLMDFIVILPQVAFRIKPLLAALGVTSKDFIENTVVDDDGKITMIGKVKPVGQTVVVRLQDNRGEKRDVYPREVGGYLPKKTGADSREAQNPGDSDAGDTDVSNDADDDLPF